MLLHHRGASPENDPAEHDNIEDLGGACQHPVMRTTKSCTLLLLAVQAYSAMAHPHDDLMDLIEKKVVMPNRASPLQAYGRNYTFNGPDEVRGLYQLPFMVFTEHTLCSSNGEPCSKEDRERLQRDSDARQAAQAAPGTRRWFDNFQNLPKIADGGCTVVGVRYIISTGAVSAACSPR